MPIGKKKTLITVLVLFGALLLASAAAVMLPPEKRTAQAASPEGIPLTASFTGASLENGKAYYLANDIALSAALEITGKNVAIDLNGHKLAIADGAQSVMRVTGDNTVVTVKDSDPNSAHADTDIRGGMITGSNNQTQYNSGVYLDGAAVFNMYGGSIAENASSCGGGVSMHGTSTFNMYGGSIVGNTAKATDGGANLSGQPVFNMYGGSIVGNASGGSGGGANVTGGVFNMSGGSVIGNKITAYGFSGGGVYVAGTGVFNVSGAPEISGNKVVANNDNVHLVNTNVAKITVVGDLRDGSGKKAKKFVASPFPKNSAFTSGYGEKCGGVSPSEYFFADDGGCVQASVGEVTVGSHSWNDDGSCGSCAQIATVVVADHGEGASTHCFASFDDAWKYANDNKDAALAIRLADDVATENLLIRGFTDLTIDLNGKMLSLADGETDSVISVDDSKFTLDDGEKSKAEDKKTPHDIGNGVTVRGGTVTGGNGYGGRGGGVYVWSGTFDMAGGTIAGNIFIPDNDIR